MIKTILQISDCHLVYKDQEILGVDTQASLEMVLSEVHRSNNKIDAIVATGDLAHIPKKNVYERLFETIKSFFDLPLLCIPGNHDVLSEMKKARLPMDPLNLGGWSIVWLDSHEDEATPASVTEADEAYLIETIEEAQGGSLLIAMHHPLLDVGSPWLDKHKIKQADRLVNIINNSPQVQSGLKIVKGFIFGHAHQEVVSNIQGLPALGCPSTCFQFTPHSRSFHLSMEAPGCRILRLGTQLESEVYRSSFAVKPVVK